jgi:hypothetical protein
LDSSLPISTVYRFLAWVTCAFNKFSAGEILKGSTINGYRIIRLKLYQPKDKQTMAALTAKHQPIVALRTKIKKWQADDPKKYQQQIKKAVVQLKAMQDDLRKARRQDIYERTIHYHSLIHRLVAEYFVKPKSPKHTIVGHLDYNRRNNRADNLQWMTPEENYKHQQSSPNVIREKKERSTKFRDQPRGAKLKVEQVRLIKQLLNKGKPIPALVKKFKVSDTQILRIKNGRNWGHVKPGTD